MRDAGTLTFKDGGGTPGWDDACAIAGRVIRAATVAHVSIACAESCTGGLVAAALTSVAGSSAVFLGGIVSYDPAVKHAVLGVPMSVIATPGIGVVSAECARAMAEGAARVTGASLAVSTTGIAGPTGAEPGKPVGTVFVGACAPSADGRVISHAIRHAFDGDREAVRLGAAYAALAALYGEIVNH